MNNLSHWEAAEMLGNPDTIVIGAGIVGLCAATRRMELRPNERVVVLERSPFGGGGSTKNAGFACFGSITELLVDLQSMNESEVIALVAKRFKGLQHLRSLIGDTTMGYSACGSHELFTSNEASLAIDALQAIEPLNALLAPITGRKTFLRSKAEQLNSAFGFSGFTHAISNELEGALNTGLLMRALRRKALEAGAELYSGVQVDEVVSTHSGAEVRLGDHAMKCRRVLVCTNGFAASLIPELDVRAARNLVLLTAPHEAIRWSGTFHMNEGYVYFRNVGNRLLIGGARHLDHDDHSGDIPPEGAKKHLLKLVHDHIMPMSEFTVEREWLGYLGIGAQRATIVTEPYPNIYCGVRMGGMGVAIGALIGNEVAELAG